MKPESAGFVRKARSFLDKASGMLAQGWADEAGRVAYLAGFHAAQALLQERTGRTPKTHAGVQGEFAKLMQAEPGLSLEQRRFLGRTYNLKAIADYETGDAIVTPGQATEAIQQAQEFVAAVVALPPP